MNWDWWFKNLLNNIQSLLIAVVSGLLVLKIYDASKRQKNQFSSSPSQPDLSDPRLAEMWEHLNTHSTSLLDYLEYVNIIKELKPDDVTVLFMIRDFVEPDYSDPKTIDIARRLHGLRLISPLASYGGAVRYGISENIGRCFLCTCGVPMRNISTKEIVYSAKCKDIEYCPLREG